MGTLNDDQRPYDQIERLQRALHENEERYRVILENAERSERVAHEALERERVLQRVTQGLARDRTVQEMGDTMLDGVELFEAPMIYVGAVDFRVGRITMLAARGYADSSVEDYGNVGLDADVPIAEAARTARLVEVASLAEVAERYPARRPAFERLGIEASAVQPVVVDDEVAALIALNYRVPHRLRAEEEALLGTLSRILAQALARARAYEAERSARGALQRAMSRLGRLQAVTAALTPQLRRDEVAATVLGQVKSALGAEAAGLFVPDERGDLEALDDEDLGGWESATEMWPETPMVLLDAFRAQQLVWVPTRGELRRRYPGVSSEDQTGAGSVFATPLVFDGTPRGVLGLLFRREAALTKDERRLASTIGQQAAQALERARLYESERALSERTAQFQEVAAALAAAATPAEIAEVLAGPGARAVDAVSCVVGMVEQDGQHVRLLGPRHRESVRIAFDEDGPSPGPEAIASRRAVLLSSDDGASERYSGLLTDLGERAWVSLPLITDAGAIGFLTFGFATRQPPKDAALESVRTMAAQASQALDRARLFAMEHEVARVLQRSLLPRQREEAPTLLVCTRYEAGADHLEVGGDWFEIVSLLGNRIGIAVGDVVGRGLNAAAAMGQMRSALRALALQELGPRGVLDALELFAERTPGAAMSTVVYGELDPDSGEFRFCSAGHPPPLLEVDGDVRVLEGGRSPLLAVGHAGVRVEDSVRVPPGATLVLYTDGLVERRGELFDRGIQRLSRALRATTEMELEGRCDELLNRMLDGVIRDDDVALLCVRRAPDADRRFRAWLAADASELGRLRHRLDAWLRARNVSDDDVEAAILAVNETVANAIEHGSRGRGRVEFVAELRDGELVASVRDRGPWLDRPSSPDRGRGLLLVRALIDEVDVRRGVDGMGTTVELKRRTRVKPEA